MSCDEEFPIKELVVNAMKLGATDLEIVSSPFLPSYLQQDVLGCESLVNLSLMWCEIIGNCLISCSRLKSLDLKSVTVVSDTFDDIISCCSLLEELSLYDCRRLQLKPFRLPKLKRLLLDFVDVDTMFFANFASSFPCLKDLTVLTVWVNGAHIASNSLETITFQPPYEATFDVPNIRKFTYSGYGLPSILVKGASREWKFDISIVCYHLYNTSWFLNMKTTMKKCRLSRIVSLCINLQDVKQSFKHELGTHQVEAEPLMVDNLRIEAPASIFSALLLRLFVICRPKFITQYWLSERCQGWMCKNECLDILCRELMKELITPNSGVPDQYVFRQFGMKKVNMEVYEEFDTEQWRPLPLKEPLNASKAPVQKRKVRLELIWD